MIRPLVSFWSRLCTILLPCAFGFLTTSALAHLDGSQEYRAFWVTAFNTHYRTPAEISAMIDQARAANLNSIIVQVRKRGDAYYNSNFEPKPTDVAANFDPLADIIAKAHDTSNGKQRLEVHAWIVSFHIWNATNNPSQPTHPYNLHPDWLSKTESGQMFDGNYTFDQGHPGVLEHTYNVCMDLVSRYDIDGLNFDYIRYSGNEWGYNDVAVERFNEQYSRTGKPQPADEAWKQFRRDQVTGLMRKVYLNTVAIKPNVKISVDAIAFAPGITNAAQWPSSAAYSSVLQDWHGWLKEGIIDLAIPMTYFRHHESARALDYRRWNEFIKDHQYDRHSIIGPGTYLNYASNAITQMRITREPSANGNHGQGLAGYVLGVPTIGDIAPADFFKALTQPGITDEIGNVIDPNPTPLYVDRATIPPMPWKVTPTKGHIKGFVYGGANIFDGASVTLLASNSRTITNDATGFYGFVDLAPGTYTLTARAPGYGIVHTNVSVSAGVVTTLDLHLAQQDNVFPQISSVTTTNVGSTTATIFWTTDEPANSVVEFGTGIELTNVVADSSHVRIHSVTLSNLSQRTGYFFRVKSTDPSGNQTVSETYTFMTYHDGYVPDLIIDNPDATVKGSWTTGTGATDKYGSNYRFRTAAFGNNYLEYRPTIITNGTYGVYAWYPQGANRPTDAPYIIRSANGTTTVKVNQRVNGGRWNHLGDFKFDAGTNGYVRISDAAFNDGSNPQVMADAIKFASTPPPVDIIVDNSQAELDGLWSTGNTTSAYGGDYNYAPASSVGDPTHFAVYAPEIAVAGRYNVYAYFSGNSTRSSRVPLLIFHEEGIFETNLNQTVTFNGWRKIASNLPFAVGTDGFVEIANDTGENIFINKAIVADAFRFSLAEPPSIILNPLSKVVTNGGSADFAVTAFGSGDLWYQWKFNGQNIPGANTNTLTLTNLTMSNSGTVTVEIGNESGSVLSLPATLLVKFAVTPKFGSINRLPDGRFEFHGSADNANFFIEVSTNLVHWDTVSSVLGANGSFSFSDSETNLPARYYRMRWQP